MNLLLDTNVLIDYLGRKEPFFENAASIVAAGFFGDANLWMAAQSPKDAFYVLNKHMGSARVQKALLAAYEVISPVSLTSEDLIQAARLEWNDYEDCLIALAAQKAHSDYLITRNIEGFSRSMVTAITPQDWVNMMRERGFDYSVADLD